MGIIYDGNVEEKKLYKAYGLTAYGKINRYVWTIHNNKEDECIITLRIVDSIGNNLLNLYLGNVCIMYDTFDRTIDNFLYWIVSENPDAEQIEKQVFESLCQSDCWFNDRIRMRKFNDQRKEEEQKRIEEQKQKERAALDILKLQKKLLVVQKKIQLNWRNGYNEIIFDLSGLDGVLEKEKNGKDELLYIECVDTNGNVVQNNKK